MPNPRAKDDRFYIRVDAEIRLVDQVYEFGDWWDAFGSPLGCGLGEGWTNSITVFLEKGLDLATMRLLAERAMLNPKVRADQAWRYFCGCCWRFLDDANKLASELP